MLQAGNGEIIAVGEAYESNALVRATAFARRWLPSLPWSNLIYRSRWPRGAHRSGVCARRSCAAGAIRG
ncbi:hypothetical protein [Streptomyces violaceusniger]|uniref:hypothetical protein n=1 Tax=Streptomyces violaceusniger TaxID=68280 RepID=UPI00099649D7